jgi:hypothetical protein
MMLTARKDSAVGTKNALLQLHVHQTKIVSMERFVSLDSACDLKTNAHLTLIAWEERNVLGENARRNHFVKRILNAQISIFVTLELVGLKHAGDNTFIPHC